MDMTRTAMVMGAALGALTVMGGCSSGGAEDPSTSSPASASSTSSSSSSSSDYKAQAVKAAREYIEEDAGRLTAENATSEQAESYRQAEEKFEKAGIKFKGHDSVISAKVNDGMSNPTRVTMNICVTTDQKLMKDGKNVRTDVKGEPVEPGDHQMQRVVMRSEGVGEPWLVADSTVTERSC